MRFVSAWSLVVLAAASTAYAAPVTPPISGGGGRPPDHALRAEADAYARNIVAVVDQIVESYIRPVSRVDLLETALAGLYEAARQPIPSGLRADIQRGVDGDLFGLLANMRESLGRHDALNGPKSFLVSLQALPRVLDPYCGLAARREFQRLDLSDDTPNTGLEFVGVPLGAVGSVAILPGGIRNELTPIPIPPLFPTGPLQVLNVQPGSPGQKAGVRPGDLITRLNGQPPESPTFAALLQRLRPIQPGMPLEPADTLVRLTVLRRGRAEPLEVQVSPARYRPESVFGARRKPDGSWDYMLDPAEKIGCVRLGGIRRQCHQDFCDALRSLRASGVRGLVFDLRWCPGGYLDEATSVARLLLAPNQLPVAKQRYRNGRESDVLFTELDGPYIDFPIVVLINGETSGGGELIAGALQDYGRAAIAGQRTVGKASIQQQLDKLAIPFKLTTSTFQRPSRKNLERLPDSKAADDWGIRPDEGRELPLTADAGSRLRDWWVQATLRPIGNSEALPLDDPENDPQRLAAVQMVLEMTKKK